MLPVIPDKRRPPRCSGTQRQRSNRWIPALQFTSAGMAVGGLLAGCMTVTPPSSPQASAPPTNAPPGVSQTVEPTTPTTCDAPLFVAAASANARSLDVSSWMFSAGTGEKPEGPGWRAYVPLVARTLGTACAPASAGFAQALSDWQGRNSLTADGIMGRDTAAKLKEDWQAKRTHLTRPCIELQKANAMAVPKEAVGDDSDRRLQADALSAYRRLLAAAKLEQPALFQTPAILLIASAWRDPADDKASCTRNPGPCNGTAKAVTCSAHWSGRALDLNLGFLPGADPTDSTYANRLHQSQTAAYAWMLDNAGRFGFVNYYYEPWHWEWQGDGATAGH
jgi:D-alanyl-D-alanine carboxypeptidase